MLFILNADVAYYQLMELVKSHFIMTKNIMKYPQLTTHYLIVHLQMLVIALFP
jgi:hypothetical protein